MSMDDAVTGHGERRRERRPRAPLTDDRSWDRLDVAYFLNVSESTVRNLERSGQLPALPRINTRVLFDPKVVRAFRDGWRPPPGWRRPAPSPQVFSLGEARRGDR